MTKSNLPVADFSVNPYVGCAHACKYCYASFMKRFTNHLEPWGTFIDVKRWPPIRRTGRYAGPAERLMAPRPGVRHYIPRLSPRQHEIEILN